MPCHFGGRYLKLIDNSIYQPHDFFRVAHFEWKANLNLVGWITPILSQQVLVPFYFKHLTAHEGVEIVTSFGKTQTVLLLKIRNWHANDCLRHPSDRRNVSGMGLLSRLSHGFHRDYLTNILSRNDFYNSGRNPCVIVLADSDEPDSGSVGIKPVRSPRSTESWVVWNDGCELDT